MDIVDYFWMFVKSYNPNQYERLLEQPLRKFFIFTGLIILLALAMFTIILLPLTFEYISEVPAKTAQMQQFQLNASVAADHQVQLLGRPNVTLDLQANGTRTGDVTLTEEGILYPKYALFGTGKVLWNDITDLKNQTPTRDRAFAALIIFLLPSIIFWFFLFSMMKAAIIFLALILLGYLLPKLFRHSISFREVVKIALLAMPSLLIIDFGLYPIAPLFWWGLLITTALFFIGIALISEIEAEERHERKHKPV